MRSDGTGEDDINHDNGGADDDANVMLMIFSSDDDVNCEGGAVKRWRTRDNMCHATLAVVTKAITQLIVNTAVAPLSSIKRIATTLGCKRGCE